MTIVAPQKHVRVNLKCLRESAGFKILNSAKVIVERMFCQTEFSQVQTIRFGDLPCPVPHVRACTLSSIWSRETRFGGFSANCRFISRYLRRASRISSCLSRAFQSSTETRTAAGLLCCASKIGPSAICRNISLCLSRNCETGTTSGMIVMVVHAPTSLFILRSTLLYR